MAYAPPTLSLIPISISDYVPPAGREAELQIRYFRLMNRRNVSMSFPSYPRVEPAGWLQSFSASPWLPLIESRIESSIMPTEYAGMHDPSYLTEGVARSALNFFRASSDVLPGEPHMYPSLGGALVAEFEAPRGRLTMVISEATVQVFSVVDGEPHEFVIGPGSNSFREDLKNLTVSLAKDDAALGAPKR
jgi:hypothetical protein